MKNIFIASAIVLAFLPQISFGASNIPDALRKQQDAEAEAFFQQQAADRGAFIKAHQDIIAKMDAGGRAMMEYKNAMAHKSTWKGPLPTMPAAVSDSTFSSFMAKQLAEKNAFLAKQAQDRQNSLKTAGA